MLKEVLIDDGTCISNERPITVFAGMNVLEDLETALVVAESLKRATAAHGLSFVFKASWDKANRSHIESYRGPGLHEGLEMLSQIKARISVPIISDIHEAQQAEVAAEVIDILQIPAFLSRQTDLLAAAVKTGRPILVKKMQMMAPTEMSNVVDKLEEMGSSQVLICERGTSFGYGNLVVDPLGFPKMKRLGVPLVFDVTHALQQPGLLGKSTGGRGQYTLPLALAGVSQGLAGLFFETHPEPRKALCDGPCAIALDKVDDFLRKIAAIDALVKEWEL